MPRTSGRTVVIGLVVALAAALCFGAYYRTRVAATTASLLPAFVEPPAQGRAPDAAALGVRVGASHLPDVQTIAKALQAHCGVGGAKPAPRPAGEIDAIATASWVLVSPGERSPRVVWRCHVRQPPRDRPRPPVGGEILFAFDSPRHPLRHASFSRAHAQEADARSDLDASVRWMRGRFGAADGPAEVPAALPPGPQVWQWRFSDLVLRVSCARVKDLWVLREEVEVPWPVRAGLPPL